MNDFKDKLASAYKESDLFIYNNKIDDFISKEIEGLIIDNVIKNNTLNFTLDLDAILEKAEYNNLKKKDVLLRIERRGLINSYKLIKESVRANNFAKESAEYLEQELKKDIYAGKAYTDYLKKEIKRYKGDYAIMVTKYSILVDDILILEGL